MPTTVFSVNTKYSFEVYPISILGNEYKNVIMLGIVNPAIAQRFLDIDAVHNQVYPYLPKGTRDDPRAYDYVMIRTVSGEITVLGIPWINHDTVVEVESSTMIVEIMDVSSSDMDKVRDALILNGYNKINIKMLT